MTHNTRTWNGHDLSDAAYRAVIDTQDHAKIREFEALRSAYDKEHLEHWEPDPAAYPSLSQYDLQCLSKFITDATSMAFDQRVGEHVENVAILEEAVYDYANRIVASKNAEIELLQKMQQLPAGDLLTQVLTSSIDLVTRFDGTLTERGSFGKFNEEVDELKRAIYDLTASTQAHPQLMEYVAEELADVLITAAGMVSYAGVPVPVILTVLRRKLDTNRAKSPATHQWDEARKMVVKRPKTEIA